MTKKRPLSITVIGFVFLIAGTIGLVYHAREFRRLTPFQFDVALVCFVRLLAIVASIYLLRGRNWARWLLVAWTAYHVLLSGVHSAFQATVHLGLLAAITYLVFRPTSTAYFCPGKSLSRPTTKEPFAP